MRTSLRVLVLGTALAVLMAMSLAVQAAPTKATCVELIGVIHGHHVVRDYVVGGALDWPPAGQVDASGGAAHPGGPVRTHLEADVPPGASFCTDSNSPGTPPGRDL